MNFDLSPYNNTSLIQKQAVAEILKENSYSSDFGLALSEKEALALTVTRSQALRSAGRIEFGGGIINKLIREFCDSPYISAENYSGTISELIDAFYYFKNETLDMIGDDALISYMKQEFNGRCRGSTELLCSDALELLSRSLRAGKGVPSADADEDSEEMLDPNDLYSDDDQNGCYE